MKRIFLVFAAVFFAAIFLFGCEGDENPNISQYTITFESNGGSGVESLTVDENSNINKPADPTKEGYTFDGWFTNADLSSAVTWPYQVTTNRTLYAKWLEEIVETTYTIYWEVDGVVVLTDAGVLEGTIPSFGSTPTKPSTAQYDYTFSGWTPEVTAATEDQTYVAQFNEIVRSYTIYFESNEGSAVNDITNIYGTLIAEPNEPTRDGYHFVSWCLDSELTQEVEWPVEITNNQILFAKWNEVIPYGTYLQTLLSGYDQNPYSYIPETMMAGSSIIAEQDAMIDYSSFVNLSSIPSNGYGEQWRMIINNIEQSQTFFEVLSVVDTISSAAVVAFNNYLDSNPADAENYQFLSGIYTVDISYQDGIISFVLSYTQELPVFGEQAIEISLSLDMDTSEKIGHIQIGSANALRYIATDDSYQFGIKYLGVRRAYFEVAKVGSSGVEGKIYEYLGIDGSFTTGSFASFFIYDQYLSVIGNKSSGMMGWAGTISEIYDIPSGKLLGYEIEETLSSITYHTLWFNLSDTSGITNIKFLDAPLEDSNPYLVYINDLTTVFETKIVGGFSTKSFSRRYDIELRTQYFYYEDGEEVIEVAVLVPMLFVQEEQIDTLVADVNSSNDGLTFEFNVSESVQEKIVTDHGWMTNRFIEDKDEYTVEMILQFVDNNS